jgi:hypothetical protein
MMLETARDAEEAIARLKQVGRKVTEERTEKGNWTTISEGCRSSIGAKARLQERVPPLEVVALANHHLVALEGETTESFSLGL